MGSVVAKANEHPEITVRRDALLVSINDRLAGKPGQDIAPLGSQWMFDLVSLQLHEAEEIRRMKEDQKEELDEEQRYLRDISPRDD